MITSDLKEKTFTEVIKTAVEAENGFCHPSDLRKTLLVEQRACVTSRKDAAHGAVSTRDVSEGRCSWSSEHA